MHIQFQIPKAIRQAESVWLIAIRARLMLDNCCRSSGKLWIVIKNINHNFMVLIAINLRGISRQISSP